jgi:hypothetical protein
LIRRFGAGVLGAALAAAVACGSSPSSPSSSQRSQLSTPTPLSPADRSTIASTNGGFNLVARNAVGAQSDPVFLTFEVSVEPTFNSPGTTRTTIAQSGGDTTTLPIGVSLGPRDPHVPYYWRVHASAGDAVSQTSATAFFILEPDTSAPAAPDPPILIAPAAGATQGLNAVFVLQKPANAGWVAAYEMQVSPSASFDRNVDLCLMRPIPSQESTCNMALSPGAYYWRAQGIAENSGLSLAESLHGPFSKAVPFTVLNEKITLASIVSPAYGAQVTNPLTIQIGNAPREGAVGPMAYDITLFANLGFPPAILTTARVLENSSGPTVWTPPFEVPTGQQYSLQVVPVDTATGARGYTNSAVVTVIAKTAVPLTLQIRVPGGQGRCSQAFEIPVTADHDFDKSPVVITSGSMLRMTLRPVFGDGLTGTISGTTDQFLVAGSNGNPANVTGKVTGHNLASGKFDGQFGLQGSFDVTSCSTAGAAWTLAPR